MTCKANISKYSDYENNNCVSQSNYLVGTHGGLFIASGCYKNIEIRLPCLSSAACSSAQSLVLEIGMYTGMCM